MLMGEDHLLSIVDFTIDHIKWAQRIALDNYNSERERVPALPYLQTTLDLSRFAENGFGVAAFSGERMVGFLCACSPFPNAFRSTDAVGVFSPMGANGAIGPGRSRVFARMYQAAGGKWAKAGATSHAICLYTHDCDVQGQLFRYGFGLRTVDAIMDLSEMIALPPLGYDFAELKGDEILKVLPLKHLLDAQMSQSPCFMLRPSITVDAFAARVKQTKPIVIVACSGREVVAYISAAPGGETFVGDTPGYLHIDHSFCLPGHRGKGISRYFLTLLALRLREYGYSRLGVDFESINPAGYNFWLKYFTPYGHGVVRRIDEKAFGNQCLL